MITAKRDYRRVLDFGDLHVPYEDEDAWACLIEFIRWWKPDKINILGDVCDFHAVSKFDKHPRDRLRLKEDLARVWCRLSELRAAAGPVTEIVLIEGNHCMRWPRYLWQNEVIADFEALQLPNLFGLNQLQIRFVSHLESEIDHGFLVEHGHLVSRHSSYTAKRMWEERGCCGISGHSHRFGSYVRRDYGGYHGWYEAGCLCRLDPPYMKAPNWHQGFVIRYHSPTGRYELHQLPIISGKAVYAGIEFTPEEAPISRLGAEEGHE